MAIDLVMLSIIIPTLNEEKYLPLLLDSIKKQSFQDYEIIVADAGSQDSTRDVALKYGCKVAAGGLPAKGRNEGAKAAVGGLFLFVDADAILPKDFLEKSIHEFLIRNLGVAAFHKLPAERHALSGPALFLYNLVENLVPFGGMVVLAKKEIHDQLRGFNEQIRLGEDTDYLWRAKRMQVFGMIKSTRFLLSLRRFERQGYLKTILTYVAAGFYMLFFGPPKSDIFKYRFDIYRK